MREIEKHNMDKIESRAEIPMKTEKRLIGTIRKHRNHKCYEYNTVTGELKEANYEVADIMFSDSFDAPMNYKVVIRDGCKYFTALNEKNAKRKLLSIK